MKMNLRKCAASAVLFITAVLLTACSSEIKMDRKTGVVEIDGMKANNLVKMFGLDYTFEVSVDPETGAVQINRTPINELSKFNNEAKEEKKEDIKEEVKDGAKTEAEDKNADENKDEDAESDTIDIYDECGVNIDFSEAYDNILGYTERGGAEIGFDADIYEVFTGYVGVSKEWIEEAYNNGYTEEDLQKINSCMVNTPSIFVVNKKMSLKDMIKKANGEYEYELEEKYFEDLGESDNYRFYKYYDTDQENINNLDPDFKEEYGKVLKLINKAIDEAKLYDPVDKYKDMVGRKLNFTTTDIDGNKVSSEKLFGKNDITMINVWATWCGPCKGELPELEEMNKAFSKKNCEIIGLLGDAEEDGAIDDAKQILKDAGVTYQIIKPWEGALEDDLTINAWPTTYFVDSEGVVLCKPVVGADLNAYETVLDKLLKETGSKEDIKEDIKEDSKEDTKKDAKEDSKEDTKKDIKEDGKTADKAAEKDQSAVTPNGLELYRVFVTDSDDKPVEGAMIQLCDDSTCRVEKTDARGIASFKTDKNNYDVHVLGVPKGCKKYTDSHKFTKEYADMHITLEKE